MSTLLKDYRNSVVNILAILIFIFGFSLTPAAQVNFSFSTLTGASTLQAPTTMQFGPDGKLYVGTEGGKIFVYTIAQTGPTAYTVTSTQVIPLVAQIPNHNDDGSLYTGIFETRQVTGLLVAGTAANPIIYVSSSDPRVGGGGSAGDLNLDTNSGIISKLTWNGSSWDKVDLVRGLPRSEENHAVNGLTLDKTGKNLYLAVGGHTNAGSPSNNFAYLNEYALSAAILEINIDFLGTLPVRGVGNTKYVYDIPTLNDPTRPDVPNPDYMPSVTGSPATMDQGDPFGGNDGLNQAKIIPGAPVQVYASGFRNPYDVVITKTPGKEDRMYTIDNGANGGWGGYPKNPNTPNVTNEYMVGEPGSTADMGSIPKVNNLDNMHLVSKPGMTPIYGGHPNPIRANPGGAGLYYYDGVTATYSLTPTVDWPPVPIGNAHPVEGNVLVPGIDDGALTTFPTSTNGITEYTSTNYFGGQMAGDILAADFSGIIWRMKLNAEGTQIVSKEIFASGFGEITLDVIAQGTGAIFEGTIWSCDYTANKVYIFTPQGSVNCSGNNTSTTLDDDEDGFSNKDESDNGTNPCNASSFPADFDNDKISNLNDSDDDNDGIQDVNDKFHRDAQNGQGTASTLLYPFLNGNPGTGLFGMGLTGLMSDGTTNPDALYDATDPGLVMGGAVGLASFPANNGNALNNTQKYAFQFGYKVNSSSPQFSVQTSMIGPFFNGLDKADVTAMHRQGIFIGTGDQDNYLMVALSGNGSGNQEGIRVLMENGGAVAMDNFYPVAGVLNLNALYFYMEVNPATGSVVVKYKTSANGAINILGSPVSLSGSLLTTLQGPDALAVGIIAHSGTTTTYSAKWDYMNILTNAPAVANPIADIETTVNSSNQNFDVSNVFTDDEGAGNITLSISGNSNPAIATASLNGSTVTLVFGSDEIGSTTIKVKATDSDGFFVEEAFVVNVIPQPPATSILINAGGSLETYGSQVWVEDQYFTGGAAYTQVTPIANTTKPALYQSERWGEFSYAIPVPNGTYTVKLHFADFYFTAAGQRKFNVNVEGGQGVLTNYDIVAKAGGNSKAVIETLNNISVTDGVLNMNFISLVDNAKVSAIEIISVSGGGANVPPVISNAIPDQLIEVNTPSILLSVAKVFTDNNGPSNITMSVSGNTNTSLITSTSITNNFLKLKFAPGQTGTATIKIKALDGGGLFIEDEFVVEVVSVIPTPTTSYSINSGGQALVFEGKNWLADQFFVGGSSYGNNVGISGTNNDALYQVERTENFSYAIPVPNGTYGVKLHFAEIFWQQAGKRVINVNVENNQGALTNYDVYVQAGGAYTAVVEQFNNIVVSDGMMNISFAGVVDNAKVSGIEVFSLPGAVNTEPQVTNPLPTQIVYKNSGTKTISIANVFTDNAGANNLVFSVSGNTNTALITNAVITGTNLVLTIAPNATGISVLKVKATDQGGLFVEDEFNVNVQSQQTLTSLKIAAGSLGFTFKGQTWSNDIHFSGGWLYSDTNIVVTNSENTRLYQYERDGDISYAVPVLPGNYTVKLHFADLYWTQPGQRVFKLNVENGKHVFNNFDIVALAGGTRKAFVQVFDSLDLSDGFLNLSMEAVVDNAKISGIEIIPYTNGVNASPELLAPIADIQAIVNAPVRKIPVNAVFGDDKGVPDLYRTIFSNTNANLVSAEVLRDTLFVTFKPGQIGNATITLRATDGQGLFVDDVFNVEVLLTAPPSNMKINAGGPSVTLAGVNWLADQYFTGGNINTNTNEISNSTIDEIYQSERWDNIVYNIPVSNSAYTVRLHFSENYYTAAGQRKFNVNVEGGQGGLTNYDIFAKAGGLNKAIVETFNNIVVNDGVMNLTFVNVVGNAKICGIEIIPYSASNTAPIVANAIPDQSVVFNTTNKVIDLGNVFSDNDGAANITLTVSNNSNPAVVASANIVGNNLTVTFVAGQSGTSKIKIRATDQYGLFVEDEFDATVQAFVPILYAPIIANAIADQEIILGTTTKVIDLTGVFTDDKGDANITLSISGNTNIALISSATISGKNLTLTFVNGVSGIANIKVKATDSDAQFAEDEFKVEVAPAPATHIRIAAGGLGHTFGTEVWGADQYFTDGSAYGNTAAIAGTTNDLLYQNERWGNSTYNVPVPNGTYKVRLHFAEIFHTAVGLRVFNVNVENGQAALNNYDIFAKAGASTAVVELLSNINVTDGVLTIALTGVTDNAKISGIEVISNSTVPNAAPVVSTPIPDQSAAFGATSKLVSLANVFNDDQGAANLTYTISGNTNTALVSNASVSGNNLTLSLGTGQVGTSTIKVKATDAQGLFVEDVFVMTVSPANTAPVVVSPIADQSVSSGTTSRVVNLAGIFNDDAGAAALVLTISGNSNTALVTAATISGTNLTLTIGAGTGVSTIKVKATDAQGLFIEDEFVVTVSTTNTPPVVVVPIADQSVTAGTTSKVVNLTGAFNDNGGAANITLSVSGNTNPALVTAATLSGTNLTLTIGAGTGVSTIKVKATDAQGLFVEDEFIVTVSSASTVNTKPVVNPVIPDMNYITGVAPQVINMANYFSDDNGIGNITFTVSSNSNTALITSAVVSGTNLTITMAPGVLGNSVVTMKATDAQGLFVTDAFVVRVAAPPKEKPVVVAPIPDQLLPLGTASKSINVTGVFTDEKGVGNLTLLGIRANSTLISAISVSGGNLNLTFAAGKTGESMVRLRATDSDNLVTEDTFYVTVANINTAPVVTIPITDQVIVPGTASRVVSIAGIFNDNNGAANLAYSVTGNTNTAVVTSAVLSGTNLTLTLGAGQIGIANIKVRATDAEGLFVEDEFIVNVTSANTPPVVTVPVADQFVSSGTPGRIISLLNTFTDNNGAQNITLSVTGNSNPALVTGASLSGTNLSLTFGAGTGNATIKLKATDAEGLFVEDEFVVNVSASNVNTKPVLTTPIPDMNFISGVAPQVINLTNYFTDDNGAGNLIFTVSSNSNPALVAAATVNGTNLTITFASGVLGNSVLTIKAADAQGLFVTDAFVVRVAAPPLQKPVVVSPIPDQLIPLGTASRSINISGVFTDEKGVANLTYLGIRANSTLITAISVSGGNLNMTFGAGKTGESMVRLRATDGDKLVTEDTFYVTVSAASNAAPVVSTPISDQSAAFGTASKVVSFANAFTDDNGAGNITYTISGNSNTTLVTNAAISGTNLTLTLAAGQSGTSNVKVKATDAQGLFVEDEFVMTVTPPVLVAPVVANVIPDQAVTLGTASTVVSLANVFSDDKGAGNLTLSVTGNTNAAMITAATISGTNLTLTFATGLTGTANIKVKALDSDGLFVEDEFKVDVTGIPTPTTLLRIAAGGPGHTFGTEVWSADQYFSGGNAYGQAQPIDNTTNDLLYQNERWGDATYSVPVPNGLYTVKLHFAEIFWTTPGNRIFNVAVETNQGVLSNYDIVAKAGGGTKAVIEQFTNVNVTDGFMTISLTSIVDNAKISGIEIISNATSGGNTRVARESTFDAQVNNSSVEVNWTPATDKEAVYTIERSKDGKLYEEMQTTVITKKDMKLPVRRFADIDPHSGTSFYRLKSVDRTNGNISYSATRTINISKNNHSFMLYPNPNNSGTLFMEFPKDAAGTEKLQVRILSIQGGVVYQQSQPERAGLLLKVALPRNLANGSYIVEIEKNGKRYHSRFILNR
jgi:hypothetical protein